MRHTPEIAASVAPPPPVGGDEYAMLRTEIQRLKRENRALSIALSEMERIAERDMLTPLYNRRYFLSALHQRIARVERFGDRAALFYIDVNDLKAINDAHGHAAGDFILVEVATRLNALNREGDVLARIGGDEFGMLLDNVGHAEAKQKLKRLQRALESEPCFFGDVELPISAAFGMTMLVPGTSAEDLLGHADNAMYAAKRAH